MDLFKRWKWALYAAAAVLIGAGLSALIWPKLLMNILPVLLGVTLIVVGVCELAFGVGVREYENGGTFKLAQGFISIAVGLVFLFKRDVSLVFLGVVLGLWAIISGALRLTLALRQRAAGYSSWKVTLLDALLKGVIGTFMMFNPFVGLAAWTMVIGLFLLVTGVALILWIIYVGKNFNFFDF